jgi:hypothetical protein
MARTHPSLRGEYLAKSKTGKRSVVCSLRNTLGGRGECLIRPLGVKPPSPEEEGECPTTRQKASPKAANALPPGQHSQTLAAGQLPVAPDKIEGSRGCIGFNGGGRPVVGRAAGMGHDAIRLLQRPCQPVRA